MKTLRNIVLSLTLATLATASLGAMNEQTYDKAINTLASNLIENLNDPRSLLVVIEALEDQCKNNSIDIFRAALQQKGLSLCEITDIGGNTILHYACACSCPESVIKLILDTEHGEKKLDLILAQNAHGKRASSLAIENKKPLAQQVIQEATNELCGFFGAIEYQEPKHQPADTGKTMTNQGSSLKSITTSSQLVKNTTSSTKSKRRAASNSTNTITINQNSSQQTTYNTGPIIINNNTITIEPRRRRASPENRRIEINQDLSIQPSCTISPIVINNNTITIQPRNRRASPDTNTIVINQNTSRNLKPGSFQLIHRNPIDITQPQNITTNDVKNGHANTQGKGCESKDAEQWDHNPFDFSVVNTKPEAFAKSFTQYITYLTTYSQVDLLQPILDELCQYNTLLAIQAHETLIDLVRTLSKRERYTLFKQLKDESTIKMALRLVSAQEDKLDLDALPCRHFITNINDWVNGILTLPNSTPLLTQNYLRFVLPLLEPLIEVPVTRLTLSKNKLTSLPAEIGNLLNLQKLDLEHNNLHELPCQFVNLVAMKWLWLGNNQLTMLPPQINSLGNLDTLWLFNNSFSDDVKETLIHQFNYLNEFDI